MKKQAMKKHEKISNLEKQNKQQQQIKTKLSLVPFN